MTHRIARSIVLSLFMLALLLPQRQVRAEGIGSLDAPLQDFHGGEPIQLSGLYSSQTLNISIPDSWSIVDTNYIEVLVRASDLLDRDRASLTVTLNGRRVDSFPVREFTAGVKRILIPANMFTQGNNDLTFTAMLYVIADQTTQCQNWDDPSRWMSIEADSSMHISYIPRDLPLDLAYFPQAFLRPLDKYTNDGGASNLLFILPDDATADDQTSLVETSYILGQRAGPDFPWEPQVIRAGEFEDQLAVDKNLVFIGNVPSKLIDSIPPSDQNFIAMFTSPWTEGRAVLIIGDKDRRDGFSPASVFGDPTRRVLLRGNIAYLEDGYVPAASASFQAESTFEEMGYNDRSVRGIGQQDLIYRFYLPYNIDPLTVNMSLTMGHTPDLDTKSSSITIYLNGYSVAGILPTARSTNPAPIKVDFPAARFRPGVNFIRFSLDLHIPYTSCERAPQSVFATIFNSTTLSLTYRERAPIPSLKNFPLPFSDCPGATFVVPDSAQSGDLMDVSKFAFVLGQSGQIASCTPAVIRASQFSSETYGKNNLVMFGLPVDNPAIMTINNYLPQPFTPDGNAIQKGYGVLLPTSDQTASLGLLQTIVSPWDAEKTILVLTGNDSQGLQWAWDMALDPAVRDQFDGNLMVVGSDKRSNAITPEQQHASQPQFQQTADVSRIPLIGPILQRSASETPIPELIGIWVALLLSAIVSLVAYLIVRRNRKVAMKTKEEAEHE